MAKELINIRIFLSHLCFRKIKGWVVLILLCGALFVPCQALVSESVSSTSFEQQAQAADFHDEEVQALLQKLPNYGGKIGKKELEEIYRAYEYEQHVKNIILYSSIFIVLMAGAAIAFLVYTLRMRARTQRSMQEMEQVRQNFFTNITHEFRTPLTVILGITDGLKKRLADRHTEPGFDLIIRQSNEMLSLVNQLLYISKVRSVVSSQDWRTGDIVALLRMVLESVRVQTAKDLIDIEFFTSDDSIQMDFVPDYTQKLLQSLLSNSIKFTPRGGKIRVSVVLEKKMVHITIIDSGRSIAEKDLPHIFDPFYQGDASVGNLRTGIGLSLVRQMTEAMDGKIEVSSMKEQGTKFLVTLPQSHADEEFKKWLPEEGLLEEERLAVNKDNRTSLDEEDSTSMEKENMALQQDEDMRCNLPFSLSKIMRTLPGTWVLYLKTAIGCCLLWTVKRGWPRPRSTCPTSFLPI